MDPKDMVDVAKAALEKPPERRGVATSEFWLTVVASGVGLFLASGALPDTHWAVKLAGVAAAVLTTLGYQVQRTRLKGG